MVDPYFDAWIDECMDRHETAERARNVAAGLPPDLADLTDQVAEEFGAEPRQGPPSDSWTTGPGPTI